MHPGAIVGGTLLCLLLLEGGRRYGGCIDEDHFVRPSGAKVKIVLWSSDWDHSSSPVFRSAIDRNTGGWGYAHVSIDGGEFDAETGESLLIDPNPERGVVRLPRSYFQGRKSWEFELGAVEGAETYGAARALIGCPYDKMAFIGPRRGPLTQCGVVCSLFAWYCMPQWYREKIAHSRDGRSDYIKFVTPNQLAQALGAPKIEKG